MRAPDGQAFTIQRYEAALQPVWDAFVAGSKNGTFLLQRSYMDYHADRFSDFSLIVRDRAGGIIALLPANRSGDEIHSHQGLTYGGLVTDRKMRVSCMLDLLPCLLDYLAQAGCRVLNYKTIPRIYHRLPAEEDMYALFRLQAELSGRDVLSVIAREGESVPIHALRRRGAAKAGRHDIAIARSDDWRRYWDLLTLNLRERYQVRPVHSLAEIAQLSRQFPDNIQLYLATAGEDLLAGAVIYETHRVAHVQYIASSPRGRELGALDRLFLDLLAGVFRDKPFFDFGRSCEQEGRLLNRGLIEQKEGFGARALVQDFYRIAL